ncbi:hypothetical protein D9M69_646910 [compost metagenome]
MPGVEHAVLEEAVLVLTEPDLAIVHPQQVDAAQAVFPRAVRQRAHRVVQAPVPRQVVGGGELAHFTLAVAQQRLGDT